MSLEDGKKVVVHYTGKLKDGTIFDSSADKDPLEFELGSGTIIKGFDDGIRDMATGDKKTVEISSQDAYGDYIADLVKEYPVEVLNGNVVEVGQTVFMESNDGRKFPCQIIELSEEVLKVDFNHPLAGKDLVFDLELVEVK